MWVKDITLEGFKSYDARTTISHLDRQFNAITGLNGSGKSNILDAITFVLGLTHYKDVRANNLLDLVYNQGKPNRRKAIVSLNFDNSDPNQRPDGLEDASSFSVTRTILIDRSNASKNTASTTSKFQINSKACSRDDVKKLFQSVGLNIDNPNFLIRQGQAMRVIKQGPKDFLQQVEEAAGTYVFFQESLEASKKLQKLQAETNSHQIVLENQIRPTLVKQSVEIFKFREAQEHLERLKEAERIVPAKDYVELAGKVDALRTEIEHKTSQRDSAAASLAKGESTIATLKQQLQTLRESQTQVPAELQQHFNEVSQQSARVQSELEGCAEAINHLQNQLATFTHEVDASKQSLEALVKGNQTFTAQHQQQVKHLEQLQEELESNVDLLAGLESGGVGGNKDSGYANQARTIRDKISSLNGNINRANDRLVAMASAVSDHDYERAQQVQQERLHKEQQGVATLKALEAEVGDMDTSAHDELLATKARLELKLKTNDRQASELVRRDNRLDTHFPGFSRSEVKGLVGSLFSCKQGAQDKTAALEMCAGGRLYNVVVESDSVADRLLKSGLKRRLTFLPLNKISSRRLDNSKVQVAKSIARDPSQVDLALEMIEFAPEVAPAMQYVFGTTLIASDPNTASSVTFDSRVRTRSITTQGDVYDPTGTLSGGAAAKSSGALQLFQQYNGLVAEGAVLRQELEQTAANLSTHEIAAQAHNTKLQAVKEQEAALNALKRKLLDSTEAKQIKEYESNQQESERINSQLAEWQSDLATAEGRLEQVQKDSVEFSKNKDGKLDEIRATITALRAQVKDVSVAVQSSSAQYEQVQEDSTLLNNKIRTASERAEEAKQEQATRAERKLELESELDSIAKELKSVERELNIERAKHSENSELMKLKEQQLETEQDAIGTYKMEDQVLGQELQRLKAQEQDITRQGNELRQQYEFLSTHYSQLGKPDTPYDFNSVSASQMQTLRNLLGMADSIRAKHRSFSPTLGESHRAAEKEEANLTQKISQLNRDCRKILTTVQELEGKRDSTVREAYKTISSDMGNIFESFLAGSTCELVPVDNSDIHKGIKIRVRIGSEWRESVEELSGGQKSLVGLSFIFAMLKYRPAPLYILDEVDAALDENHTQNLGKIIKKHFKQAQFVLVSLKDGLYTSGNRVYHVQNHNGRSAVSLIKS